MGWFSQETREEKRERRQKEVELQEEANKQKYKRFADKVADILLPYMDCACLNSKGQVYWYKGTGVGKNSTDNKMCAWIYKINAAAMKNNEWRGNCYPWFYLDSPDYEADIVKHDRMRYLELKADLDVFDIEIVKKQNNKMTYLKSIDGCDGYKVDHKSQYPKNTVKVFSNFTPRKSRVDGIDEIIFFGLTYFIKDVLIEEFKRTFFSMPKESAVKMYKRRLDNYLGPNGITYEHIEQLHDLGYIPVTIKALPEGALVKTGVPVLTITNELPDFFWVPNFLETVLSCEIWPMCTSATTAFNYRLIFDSYALATTGNTGFSSTFQAHDFSMRGQMGRYAAAMNGAAHLTSFCGTDTIPAIDFLEHFYGADSDKELVGASVPATEHSVMCMGMQDGELETFKRLINEIYPKGFISIVSDTWDFWGVVRPGTGILAQLHNDVMARDGRVVIRPDSGDPIKIITGYTDDELTGVQYESMPVKYETKSGILITEEERKGAIECLWEEFGGITNELGYKELDTHIGLIYGDSITLGRASAICQRLKDKGFASTNWVAGVGSYSYQYVTRDTFGWAMKATYGEIGTLATEEQLAEIKKGGFLDIDFNEVYLIEPREIFKDPITDRDPITGISVKKSAKGLLRVDKDGEGYYLTDQVTDEEEQEGELKVVYQYGELIVDPTLAEIRARVSENVLNKLK